MLLRRVGILVFCSIVYSQSWSAAASPSMQDASHRLYDRVMSEFKHRDYDAALAGFRLFIELHSQSDLAANAQYWIGECHYRRGRYRAALKSFSEVLANYPLSQKLPASTLKLGQIYTKLGDQDTARMMFDRVMDQYPDSSEAELARKAVDAMVPSESEPTTPSPE